MSNTQFIPVKLRAYKKSGHLVTHTISDGSITVGEAYSEKYAILFEAAPDMYEALKEMNDWVSVNFPEHGMKHEFGTCASFNKMRSALNKANPNK